jgi:hypothetical protein
VRARTGTFFLPTGTPFRPRHAFSVPSNAKACIATSRESDQTEDSSGWRQFRLETVQTEGLRSDAVVRTPMAAGEDGTSSVGEHNLKA